jgi:hypothetical protein
LNAWTQRLCESQGTVGTAFSYRNNNAPRVFEPRAACALLAPHTPPPCTVHLRAARCRRGWSSHTVQCGECNHHCQHHYQRRSVTRHAAPICVGGSRHVARNSRQFACRGRVQRQYRAYDEPAQEPAHHLLVPRSAPDGTGCYSMGRRRHGRRGLLLPCGQPCDSHAATNRACCCDGCGTTRP